MLRNVSINSPTYFKQQAFKYHLKTVSKSVELLPCTTK